MPYAYLYNAKVRISPYRYLGISSDIVDAGAVPWLANLGSDSVSDALDMWDNLPEEEKKDRSLLGWLLTTDTSGRGNESVFDHMNSKSGW
jgi:hypothetical protein